MQSQPAERRLHLSCENTISATILPVDSGGDPVDAPFTISDATPTPAVIDMYVMDAWHQAQRHPIALCLSFDQLSAAWAERHTRILQVVVLGSSAGEQPDSMTKI